MHTVTVGAGVVVADVDAPGPGSGDAGPRVRVSIGPALSLLLEVATADDLADALVGVLSDLADRPAVTW